MSPVQQFLKHSAQISKEKGGVGSKNYFETVSLNMKRKIMYGKQCRSSYSPWCWDKPFLNQETKGDTENFKLEAAPLRAWTPLQLITPELMTQH